MKKSDKDSDAVLERARVREVTGIFHSRLALDVAAGELLLMGFDRADIDVVAGISIDLELSGLTSSDQSGCRLRNR